MRKPTVLILGAGPAGMAAAFTLHNAGKSFLVIEKERAVGGLSKTLQYPEFATDIGPHRFFSQRRYLYDFLQDLLGERWIKVSRHTSFYWKGKFLTYPIDIKNILSEVGLVKVSQCIFDYLYEQAKNKFKKRQIRSFEDYVISNFGKALARLNMLDYTEKIWGLPCSDISSDWAKQRIKRLSIKELIRNAFVRQESGQPNTLIRQFYYPDKGIGLICDKMKERILSKDTKSIKLNSHPVKIKHNGRKITEVSVVDQGGVEAIEPEYVIATIPVTELVNMLEPVVPGEILHAAGNLKFRSHVSLFLTLNKTKVSFYQWIYFPDKEIPFGRITEPKNCSPKLSPPDKTSLLIEFFCWENDKIWSASEGELLALALPWLKRAGLIQEKDIIDSYLHREKYAYPVYELNYKEDLDKVKDRLRSFENLQCIGRNSLFRYNNMDHSLEMGILSAKSIIDGRRYDEIEEVGIEQTYFEKGYFK
jgi:protoporphyrinogen oxidase